jgi:hypothetical protein
MDMNMEQFWPREKVYLYGTCAIFPEKINGRILGADQLGGYIEHFPLFTDDNQVKALKEYETRKMFKVEFLETRMSRELSALDALEKLNPYSLIDDKHKYKFRITNVDREKFKTDLIKYLKRFSEDELTNKFLPIKPEPPEVLMGRLHAFAEKARRKRPKVTLYDIWPNANDRNVLLNPFWEIIFSSELIFDDAKIIDIGQSPMLAKKVSARKSESLPFAEIEVVNPKWIEIMTQKSTANTMLDLKQGTNIAANLPPVSTIDPSKLKVLHGSYDSANHILTLAGEKITIMKQTGRKKDTKEAKLLAMLFSVKYFYEGVGLSKIYPDPPYTNPKWKVLQRKKAKALVTAINEKLPEELTEQELILFDKIKFYINPQYKKN